MRYASFIPQAILSQKGVHISAGEVLRCFGANESGVQQSPNCLNIAGELKGRSIIVGGNWNKFGIGVGGPVDDHKTPVGMLNGSLIHLNFVESMLDDRSEPATSIWLLVILQISISLAALFVASRYQSKATLSAVCVFLFCPVAAVDIGCVAIHTNKLRDFANFSMVVLPERETGHGAAIRAPRWP